MPVLRNAGFRLYRSTLGPLRILNFAALSIIVTQIFVHAPRLLSARWLTLIGAASLQTVAAHVPLVLLCDTLRWRLNQYGKEPAECMLAIVLAGILAAIARWYRDHRPAPGR